MTKVLILGANGNLGPALTQIYHDCDVVAWDRNNLDITNEAAVLEKIAIIEPDLVYNCAAYNAVDAAEDESALADSINGYAVGFIAKACEKVGATLIHYSTEQVFNGQNPNGYNEADQPEPVNRYGQSKLLGEQQLQKYHTDYYLIRTEWLYAPTNRFTGKKSFNDIMLDLAQAEQPLKGVVDEIGRPTYVHDLAAASRKLVDSNAAFGIYHLTNEGRASRLDWAKEIFQIKNINATIEPVTADSFPRKAKRPRYGLLNNTKAPALRLWQEALKEYLTTNHPL